MGSSRVSKNSRKTRNRHVESASTRGVRLSEARAEAGVSPLINILSFAGYMLAMWLIAQSVNSISSPSGILWSPAVLGVVLGATTAIARNERGVRSYLHIDDFSSRRASLVWGGLGVIGIFAIVALPR